MARASRILAAPLSLLALGISETRNKFLSTMLFRRLASSSKASFSASWGLILGFSFVISVLNRVIICTLCAAVHGPLVISFASLDVSTGFNLFDSSISLGI